MDYALLAPPKPIMDVTSNDLICNGGINPYHTPISTTVIPIPAGAQVTAEWHHTLSSANTGDASDPIDASHHGPVMAYLAKVPSATQTSVTGLQWFKIYHDGLDSSGKWGVDRLVSNKGKVTFTIPNCIAAGQYLLRVELIGQRIPPVIQCSYSVCFDDAALHAAQSYPGAQFYMECAQLQITGGGSTSPATVSFPGAYKGTDPGVTVNIYNGITSYTIPGPSVFSCNGQTNPTTTSSNPTTTHTTTSAPTTTAPSSGTVAQYGQCGGLTHMSEFSWVDQFRLFKGHCKSYGRMTHEWTFNEEPPPPISASVLLAKQKIISRIPLRPLDHMSICAKLNKPRLDSSGGDSEDMYFKTSLLSLVAFTSVHARTVFTALSVNGVDQGLGVGVRVPIANTPITDITSNSIICNTGFIQPISQVVIPVPAGGQVTAQFHKTSAGYVGPDPADPLDPTNKGPVLIYLAAVPSATQSAVTGLKWFKIFEWGYDTTTHQWGSDKLFVNKGNITFTIPPCIKSGQYLLRAESIALQSAAAYPGAQFYMSCAQLSVIGGSAAASPSTVSFPDAYTPNQSIVVPSIYSVTSYVTPGPAVFTC
ncbi:hypothetical protein DXG01_006768 [Tephrocybe rancida]|nr:hypothetical protein DXG01_006768 [Tephrocybe rancida]